MNIQGSLYTGKHTRLFIQVKRGALSLIISLKRNNFKKISKHVTVPLFICKRPENSAFCQMFCSFPTSLGSFRYFVQCHIQQCKLNVSNSLTKTFRLACCWTIGLRSSRVDSFWSLFSKSTNQITLSLEGGVQTKTPPRCCQSGFYFDFTLIYVNLYIVRRIYNKNNPPRPKSSGKVQWKANLAAQNLFCALHPRFLLTYVAMLVYKWIQ